MKIDIHRIALTCEEARKAEHPMTKCMEDQGKHAEPAQGGPGAFCNHFLSETCDLAQGKDFGQRKKSTMVEKFAGMIPDEMDSRVAADQAKGNLERVKILANKDAGSLTGEELIEMFAGAVEAGLFEEQIDRFNMQKLIRQKTRRPSRFHDDVPLGR